MLRSKKRVAVCFSGQIRDWQIASKNILHFFSSPHNDVETIDYFIHTWDTNTWRFPKKHHHEFVNEKHNDLEKIVNVYKPVAYHMSAFKPEEWSLAWDPLFYSFEYSIMLKRQYELDNNFTYDIVIKARPDTVYNPNKKFSFSNHIEPGSCYTSTFISRFPREFNKFCFDDVMFFGDSKTMDVMSGLYKYYSCKNQKSRIQNMSNPIDIDTELHLGPGTLLYRYATEHNIHPDAFNTDYAVIRSTMRNKNLDSIEDYIEIKKLWLDWYI